VDSNRSDESREKRASDDQGAAESAARRDGGGPDADLAHALAMLDRLPLSDAERAGAVRRLLASPADEWETP